MTTSKIRKTPHTKPSITELEVQYATDAAANGSGEHCYDYVVRFEEAFKAHLSSKYAISTAVPIVHLGAKPVFVDILPDSWGLPFLCQGHVTTNVARILSSQ